MSSSNALVTIIMPAYNAAKYIAEAIESVLNQTYNSWELIIINDGSRDNTENIIKSFNDSRIILLSQKNTGVSSARNQGLQFANGEYITFLDADDILPVQSLDLRVKFLQNNPAIDLVDGKISVRDKDMNYEIKGYKPYYKGDLLAKLLRLDDQVFFGICYFFKKDILKDVFLNKNMTHAEDLLFYIEIASKQLVNYAYVDEIVYFYRSGHISAMSNMNGLENGYLILLNKVIKNKNISFLQKLYFRYKITRILFLSWFFDAKEPYRAFKSFLYAMDLKRKK